MIPAKRSFRLVVQQAGVCWRPAFRIIIYGDDPISAIADYGTLIEVRNALNAVLPEVVLSPGGSSTVIFTGEVELDQSQLRVLRLA